jgi:hypothetical protein
MCLSARQLGAEVGREGRRDRDPKRAAPSRRVIRRRRLENSSIWTRRPQSADEET